MKPQQRNFFLIGLTLLAILGVGVVVGVTRPAQPKPSESSSEFIDVQYTAANVNRVVRLTKVSSDAFDGARFTAGSSSAKNTVVEFADYQCPACGLFATQSESTFKTKLVDTGKVRYAFRDFPLPQHQNAPLAAQAASCANDQGRFAEYKAILFRGQAQWSESLNEAATAQFAEYATSVGLNKAKLLECLKSNNAQAAIETDKALGVQIGLSSTPSFVINGYLMSGALPAEAFEAIIAKVGRP